MKQDITLTLLTWYQAMLTKFQKGKINYKSFLKENKLIQQGI